LTSEISITKNCQGYINIQFLYYPLTAAKEIYPKAISQVAQGGGALGGEPNTRLIMPVLNLVKKLLLIRSPSKDYRFICIKANNKFADSKILNDYVNNLTTLDPNRLKNIVSAIVREYKISSNKPHF
jgi:hypothetical protein